MKNTLTLFLIIFFTTTILTSEIFSIPAFARKYNMSCQTCHSPFPTLKPYGDEFAGNGFELKDKDAPRYYVETGDQKLNLLRDFPIAARLEGYVTYNEGNTEQSDFYAPVIFKLMTGGAIGGDVSYYVYYILEHGETGKIEDAWLMYNNLFGSELDITIGQFQVCDPLFKRELRLTREDYQIYKVKPGLSNIDLTYDRGIMLSYGFETGTDVVLEIVNGNGIGESLFSGTFDDDKYKNFMGRVSQDLGEHLRVGGMAYWGKESQTIENEFYIYEETNEATMWGIDATFSFDPLELNLQYINREDDNPFFKEQEGAAPAFDYIYYNVKTDGVLAELIVRPDGDESDYYLAGVYNYGESDGEFVKYNSAAFHFGYLLQRNIRLVAEYIHDFENEYGSFGLGFVSAF